MSDELTRAALSTECQVLDVSPGNFRRVLSKNRPDLLLVESAWHGRRDTWRYRIASYPDHPRRTNAPLAEVVRAAKDLSIPAIFWNREDGVHYDRFIASAKFFDRILTVDENMIPAYREAVGSEARIGTMMFAASLALHEPNGHAIRHRAAFVGSYGTHVHDRRRAWQDDMFDASEPLGLTVFDRNSKRKAREYRYPQRPWIETRPAITHEKTAEIYRDFLVNLNVNTITDSSTAFSRRLVEILASGGFALTNDTKAVRTHFDDYCLVTDNREAASEFFSRVAKEGLSRREMQMRMAGADHVARHHTWRQRIPILLEMAS